MDVLLSALNDGNLPLLPQLMKLMVCAALLKDEIILVYPPGFNSDEVAFPPFLPPSIICFLADAGSMTKEAVQGIWDKAGDIIWSLNPSMFSGKGILSLFQEHGAKNGLHASHHFLPFDCWLTAVLVASHCTLWPRSHTCTNPKCAHAGKERKIQVAELS